MIGLTETGKAREIPAPAVGNPPEFLHLGVLHSPRGEPARLASWPGPAHRGISPEFLALLIRAHDPDGATPHFTLRRGPWGKPHLLVDGAPGPAVSFSWSAGAWWAALGSRRSRLGLDAASPAEFTGAYPFAKVFEPEELQDAHLLTSGNREEAAALLWSVKEAVVKAIGCGYHCFGPARIRVEFTGFGERGPCWRGRLEATSAAPGFLKNREPMPVASVRLHRVWLAAAWIEAPHGPAPAG